MSAACDERGGFEGVVVIGGVSVPLTFLVVCGTAHRSSQRKKHLAKTRCFSFSILLSTICLRLPAC